MMDRRAFLGNLAGSLLAARTHAAEAQQSDRVRRIGVLMGFAENDGGLASLPCGLQAAPPGTWLDRWPQRSD